MMLPITEVIKDQIRYWLYPNLRPRRFHAFGVGMPKSGTHSVEAIFADNYRTWHEPRLAAFMQIIKRRSQGEISDAQARDQVRSLDRKMWLEFNSSWLNYFFLDLLLEEYPDARFVFTIRDCYSWMDSLINELLGREHPDYHEQFERWYADTMTTTRHVDQDRVLEEHGLWPLETWFRVWHEHNARVIEMIPEDRLLVVRTSEISQDIPKVARFLGIPETDLDTQRSHQHKAAKKFGLLAEIDSAYLESCADKYCSELMGRYFPEIKALSDVRGYQPVTD